MNNPPCPRCNGPQIPLLTSLVCVAECDLQKEKSTSDEGFYGAKTKKRTITIGGKNYNLMVSFGPTLVSSLCYPQGINEAINKYGPIPNRTSGTPCAHTRLYTDSGSHFCFDCGDLILGV